MRTITYTFLFFILSFSIGLSQTEMPDLNLKRLKPLEELLEAAKKSAPNIRALEISKLQTKEEIEISRKNWLSHFSVGTGLNYGNGIVTDQLTSNQTDNRFTFLSRQNVTYSVGINIRLPFSEVASRKNELRIKSLEIDRIDELQQQESDLITQQVIKLYADLKYQLEAISIALAVKETNEMAMQIAEGYFKSGKIEIEEYRLAMEANYSAKLAYQQARNEAWYTFNSLKALIKIDILQIP